MVCRPTRKAARISVRTEREALEYAVMPASARLTSSTTQTRTIRRNRSDTRASAERCIQALEDAITRYQCIPVRAADLARGRARPVALTQGGTPDYLWRLCGRLLPSQQH